MNRTELLPLPRSSSMTSSTRHSRVGSVAWASTRPPAIEFAPEELTLNAMTVPRGTLLFINGESGVAEIYAVDPGTGAVLDVLVTGFGSSHVVGGGYDPVRNVFFLVQDRVPSGALGNRVAEIDPVTGAVLNSFSIASDFDVNFGDLDVSGGTGNLFVVSSTETGLGEFTPAGDGVTVTQSAVLLR